MTKEFGVRFDSYKRMPVAHLALQGTSRDFVQLSGFGVKVTRAELPEIAPGNLRMLPLAKDLDNRLLILPGDMFTRKLEDELEKVEIEVAPSCNLWEVPDSQKDLDARIKNSLSTFRYYLVELGLNVLTGRAAKVPALRFEVDLIADTPERTDVTAFDVMPKDKVKEIRVIEGKISVGITKMLELIPGPIGKALPNLLDLEINPWQFSWTIKRCEIDTSGPLNYKVYWYIHGTDLVQSFNPTMVLKLRKNVTSVKAKVRAVYNLKTDLLGSKELGTDEKTVRLLPQ